MDNRDKVREELLGRDSSGGRRADYREPPYRGSRPPQGQRERMNRPPDRGRPVRRRRKRRHPIRNLIIILLILVFAAAAFIYSKISGHINYVPLGGVEVNQDILPALQDETSGYMTVALFGVDSRASDLTSKTRTDSIMLVSLNKETNDVRILSVYRDTYLNVGNNSYTKCNAAYARGGPAQALSMLNKNLDLNIQEYVVIGFDGVIRAIDDVGGVEISVEQDEIRHLNKYQQDLIRSAKMTDYEYKPVTATGRQTLNGLQALSYCRIRYTAGDDFKRTSRQRIVLEAIVEKAKSNPLAMNKMASDILEGVATNMKSTDLMAMLPRVLSLNITRTDGVPFEDYRATKSISGSGNCVIPMDLAANVTLVHEFLYGTQGYHPSTLVEEYSAYIRNQ